MSPFKIDGLGALEFHDDDFRYRGKSVSFGAIRSIQFTASQTRHSVNFIPIGSTFSSSLCLILDQGNKVNIRQEYGYRAKTQKSNMDAVCRAAEILSQVTFNQRVERYERELADKGFFKCGQYQIAKDGGLFVNWSRVFGIHDRDVTISLHPFHLHIHRPRVGVRRFFSALSNTFCQSTAIAIAFFTSLSTICELHSRMLPHERKTLTAGTCFHWQSLNSGQS